MSVATKFPVEAHCLDNIWIPMPDGIRLAARMWAPMDGRPGPAIVECVPYRKRDGLKTRDEEIHAYFAGHGYACLRIDLRGTGDSEGLPDDEYSPAEQQDLLAANRGLMALTLVTLYKSLGGGWEPWEGSRFVSEETAAQMRARTRWGALLEEREQKHALEAASNGTEADRGWWRWRRWWPQW